MSDTENDWIEVDVNNKSVHPEGDRCTQIVALSPCQSHLRTCKAGNNVVAAMIRSPNS